MTLIRGTEQDDWLAGGAGDDIIGGGGGNDYIGGGAGNDLLVGGLGDDRLFGNDGDDKLYGSFLTFDDDPDNPADGGDYLDGGGGYDKLYGGFGDDIYHLSDVSLLGGGPWTPYYWAFDELTEKAGQGTDTVEVASYNGYKSSYLLPENVENGLVLGDQAFTLRGNELANALAGGAGADRLVGETGDDRLDGGAGYDTLEGGAGNDVYVLPDANVVGTSPVRIAFDAVIEAAGAGVDTVQVSADSGLLAGYTLAENVENGVVVGVQAFRLSGNAAANLLTGNDAANTLEGRDGNDALTGRYGQDTLTGGAGADRFVFTIASDSVIGANADVITDFSRAQGDRIDLSQIDANRAAGGDQSFSFIGNADYTGRAGELRLFFNTPGVTVVGGDVDGDRTSDFHIRLTGTIALVAGDFSL